MRWRGCTRLCSKGLRCWIKGVERTWRRLRRQGATMTQLPTQSRELEKAMLELRACAREHDKLLSRGDLEKMTDSWLIFQILAFGWEGFGLRCQEVAVGPLACGSLACLPFDRAMLISTGSFQFNQPCEGPWAVGPRRPMQGQERERGRKRKKREREREKERERERERGKKTTLPTTNRSLPKKKLRRDDALVRSPCGSARQQTKKEC